VIGHPEFGNTFTQSDGGYDFAVNGGQTLRLHFGYSGYLPVERTVQVPWRDYAIATDVVFTQLDSQVTVVDVSSSTMGLQVARGPLVSDTAGTRTATVFVPPGTQATMTLPDGTTAPLNTMSVRATEYSVGTSGPSAMPALSGGERLRGRRRTERRRGHLGGRVTGDVLGAAFLLRRELPRPPGRSVPAERLVPREPRGMGARSQRARPPDSEHRGRDGQPRHQRRRRGRHGQRSRGDRDHGPRAAGAGRAVHGGRDALAGPRRAFHRICPRSGRGP